jgi:hypothetical protein
MAINDFASLQTAIQNWLGGRTDLTARIPEFISLAEAQIAQDLLRYTKRATISLGSDMNNLPSDCTELRTIRLVTATPSLDKPLVVTSPVDLATRRANNGDATGRPVACAVFNNGTSMTILVQPTPDQVYNAEITYFPVLVPLSTGAPTNAVLTESPGLYLYGALKEAEPFLENDERVPLWETKYKTVMASALAAQEREEYMASKRPLPLDRVFT